MIEWAFKSRFTKVECEQRRVPTSNIGMVARGFHSQPNSSIAMHDLPINTDSYCTRSAKNQWKP